MRETTETGRSNVVTKTKAAYEQRQNALALAKLHLRSAIDLMDALGLDIPAVHAQTALDLAEEAQQSASTRRRRA